MVMVGECLNRREDSKILMLVRMKITVLHNEVVVH